MARNDVSFWSGGEKIPLKSIRLNFPSWKKKKREERICRKSNYEGISAFCSPLEKSRFLGFIPLLPLLLLLDPTFTQPIVSLGVTRTSGFHRIAIESIKANLTDTTRVTILSFEIFDSKIHDFEGVTRLSQKKTRSGNKSFELGKRNYVERRWSFAGLIRGVKGIRKRQKLKGWDKRIQGTFYVISILVSWLFCFGKLRGRRKIK